MLRLTTFFLGCVFAAQVVTAKTTKWYELSPQYTFEMYTKEFGKIYDSPSERQMRKKIFSEHLEVILIHNANDNYTWKRGVNHLTDRTADELSSLRGMHSGLLYQSHKRRQLSSSKTPANVSSLPKSVDWRSKNVLTPVKNQGQCGSCWTFASTETIESHVAIKTGVLQELSEQFILDCTPNPKQCGGTGGCQGGTAELAYTRLKELGGIPGEYTYPYISGTGKAGQCHGLPLPPASPHHGGPMRAAVVTGHVSVTSNSYADILNAVATVGPLAISVDAGAWHDYESGIFDGGNATNPTLDHLVQLVGYGTDASGDDYWIVRNSWTPLWGEDGFIRLKKFGEGKEPCGLDINPLDGNGCKGGPPTVKVCGQNGLLYDGVYPLV